MNTRYHNFELLADEPIRYLKCTKCKKTKPISEYYKRPTKKGYRSDCKECSNNTSKNYYKNNIEERKRKNIQYTKTESGKQRRKEAEKRFNNTEYGTIYRRKLKMAYKKSEKGRMNARLYQQKRRNIGDLPIQEIIIKRLNLFESKCCYCDKKGILTIDHLVPVSKGGSHNKYNLFGSCRKCNSSKGNKNWIIWYRKQPFYKIDREYNIIKNTKGVIYEYSLPQL